MYTLSLFATMLPIVAASTLTPGPATIHTGAGPYPPDELPMMLASHRALETMETGRELLLRFRIEESEDAFGGLSAEPGGTAAAYYFLAYASVLKLLVSDEERYYEEFSDRSDVLSEVLDGSPETAWRTFFEAESHLQEAVVRAKRGRYLRAALSGGKAFRTYERLVQDHPRFYDAYKGLGLLHFAVGSLPGVYRTFLSVLGMHGSVEVGLQELHVAADSSLYGREEADILLSIFDILVDIDADAGTRLRSRFDEYPDSPLFGHLYGFYLYSERRSEDALAVLARARESSTSPGYFDLDFIDFYLADTLFRLERYSEAIPYYQSYLDRQKGPALKALASLGIGLSLEMIGQRLAATSFYMDVEAAREFDSDQAARKKAARLLRHPLSTVDRQLIAGQNAFDSGRYDDAIKVLGRVLTVDSLSNEARAEAHYRLGRCRHVTGLLDQAMEDYSAAMVTGGAGGSRWPPWSMYYVGRIHEAAGRRQEALAAFERALSYTGDYDYKQALEKNVKVATERVVQNRPLAPDDE